MTFHPALYRWYWRPVKWLTLILSLIAVYHVLVESDPWNYTIQGWPPFFVFLHVLCLKWILGRPRTESFAYLYSQGFTRDTLWRHHLLAYITSILLVWAPTALLIWTPLRSSYQDWLENPWFPLMADTEWTFPLWILLQYSVFLSLVQYEWIRSMVPARGIANGSLLTMLCALIWLTLQSMLDEWRSPAIIACFMVAGFGSLSLLILATSQRLHRQLEINA